MATIYDVYRFLDPDVEAPAVEVLAKKTIEADAEFVPHDREQLEPAESEIPPLDREQLEQIAAALETEPETVVARARELWDGEITEHELRALVERARAVFDNPTAALEAMSADAAFLKIAQPLPPDFTFPGIDPTIKIEPGKHTFEEVGDALGWLFFSGPFLLGNFSPSPHFLRHENLAFPSLFRYSLNEPTQATPIRIALFSDFGTAYYHSEYIAKQISRGGYDATIHLGDVYYAGRASEYRKRFRKQLDPLLSTTPLWNLNSNHEMQSRAEPYFRYIRHRLADHPGVQRQEGSYFALDFGTCLVVGIDTEGLRHKRHDDAKLQAWLRETLEQGRTAEKVTILLSGDEPYTYGHKGTTNLYDDDLKSLDQDRLIDLWFWGNTHYCALFEASSPFGFAGSCIGHGGYPYQRRAAGKHEPAPLVFLEERHRFHPWKLREDMGNNGFCEMTLRHDRSIGLRYIDWMSNVRCTADLMPSSTGGALAVSNVWFQP